MTILIASLIAFAAAMLLMGLGLLIGRRPMPRGCGGDSRAPGCVCERADETRTAP